MLEYRTGIQSADDPLEYVLSDETVDRYGDVIAVSGWKLSHFKNNPIALFNHDSSAPIGVWENVRVEKGKLIARLKIASASASERIREIRALVEERVLRAVSVGFRPLKREPLEGGGPYAERYTESELVECSLVCVPANPNALQIIKALGIPAARSALYLGKPASEEQFAARSASPGKPARAHLPSGGRAMKPTIAKQIEAAEGERNRLQDQLNDILGKDADERTAEDEVLFGNLPGEIEVIHNQIVGLKNAERAMALRASGEDDEPNRRALNGEITAPNPKRPFAVPAKKVTPKDLIIRGAAIQFMTHIHKGVSPLDMAKRMYGDDESTMWLMRAVTNPAMTTVPGWAMELVQTGIAEFLDTLPIDSVYGPLSNRGIRFTFGRNGSIKVPARAATPNLAGSFVGEGQPIPVRRLGLTSITLTPKKLGVISTFTRELANHSTPSIESVIRQAMAEDTAVAIDTVLLDDQAATVVRPAGLLYNVTPIPPSAATEPAAAFVEDMKALVTAITAQRGGRDLVILLNPAQGIGINFATTVNGEFLFTGAGDASQRLGVSFIQSPNVPADTVIAIDAADFASATGDVPEYDISDQATIHEEDTAPLPLTTGAQGAAVAATPTRSLWQTASIGVRMLLDCNWAMRRPGMVQVIEGVVW